MTRSPASARAYEKPTLSFGLVSIPVAVFAGTTKVGISRKWFTEEGHAVGYATVDKEADTLTEVPRSEIVEKIMTEYGPVYVEDSELEKLFDIEPKSIVVKAFQPQALFYTGQYVPKKPYYVEVAPVAVGKKKSPNKRGEEAFALILEAMRNEGAVAFVEFTTRGTPKPAVLLPDGTMWELYHEDELREQRPLPEVELSDAHMAMGKTFIETFWSEDVIDTTDHRTALIQDFADQKAAAGEFGKPEEETTVAAPKDTSSDLLAMLSASVDAAKAKSA